MTEKSASFRDFLSRIENTPEDTRQNLIDEFMSYVSYGGFPMVEDSAVYFVYRGEVKNSIFVAGDFNGWDPSRDRMKQIAGTDLFYRVYNFPLDARLDYKFVKDGQWILDPLNPRTVMGGFGPNSELRMPQYQPSPEIQYYSDIPHGKVEETSLSSSLGKRSIHVYLPYGYSNSNRYPVLYVQDGGDYLRFAKLKNVADYLLARAEIEPLIIVLVDPLYRNREYAMDEVYRKFVIDRLVPFINTSYSTIDSPSARCIMGASLGGLISLYIAIKNPDCFGNCATQSAPFGYDDGAILSMIRQGEKKPINLYIDCGTFEAEMAGHNILKENREAKECLISKGYKLTYHEYNEGHSWGNWRAHLDDILKTFFAQGQ